MYTIKVVKKMKNDMLKDKPLKSLLIFMLPITIGNIIQQLYGLMDSIVLGQFLGENALAAVGTTTPIAFLIIGFVQGIASGFAIIAAQRFGMQNAEKLRKSVATSAFLCLAIGMILTIVCIFTTEPILRFMNVPDSIFADSEKYIRVVFAGIAATIVNNYIVGLLRSLGDSKFPLYVVAVTSIINVIADLFLIGTLRLGLEYTAVTNIAAQLLSAIICICLFIYKYPLLRINFKDFLSVKFKEITNHLSAGMPMALQFCLTSLGVIFIQGALNKLGETAIAGFTTANKIEQLLNQPVISLSVACSTFVAQNMGARQFDRIKKGIKISFIIGIFMTVFTSILCLLFNEFFIKLFISTPTDELLYYGRISLNIFAYTCIFITFLFLLRPMLQALNKNFAPFVAGVISLFARAACAFILVEPLGYIGVVISGPVAWFLTIIPLGFILYSTIKKLDNNKNYNEDNLMINNPDIKIVEEIKETAK